MKTSKLSTAALMAGQWWTDRLDDAHADKREAFAAAVSQRVQQALDGVFYWNWFGERSDGDGKPVDRVYTECDYDAHGLLLEAVREVIDPDNRGFWFSARDILPQKHSLDVSRTSLQPKEGYGNWTDAIAVTPKEPT